LLCHYPVVQLVQWSLPGWLGQGGSGFGKRSCLAWQSQVWSPF